MRSDPAAMTVVDRAMRSDGISLTVVDREIDFDAFELVFEAFKWTYNANVPVFEAMTLQTGHVGSHGILLEYTSDTNEIIFGYSSKFKTL